MERREFLRHAAVGAAGLVLPEGEKEVVDSRLTQKVTCAFKATALSDLCQHLGKETGGEVLVSGRRVRRKAAEVPTRREHLLVGGSEDDHPRLVVLLDRPQRIAKLGEELIRERVPRLGVVEGDGRDTVCDIKADLFVGGHK